MHYFYDKKVFFTNNYETINATIFQKLRNEYFSSYFVLYERINNILYVIYLTRKQLNIIADVQQPSGI